MRYFYTIIFAVLGFIIGIIISFVFNFYFDNSLTGAVVGIEEKPQLEVLWSLGCAILLGITGFLLDLLRIAKKEEEELEKYLYF